MNVLNSFLPKMTYSDSPNYKQNHFLGLPGTWWWWWWWWWLWPSGDSGGIVPERIWKDGIKFFKLKNILCEGFEDRIKLYYISKYNSKYQQLSNVNYVLVNQQLNFPHIKSSNPAQQVLILFCWELSEKALNYLPIKNVELHFRNLYFLLYSSFINILMTFI